MILLIPLLIFRSPRVRQRDDLYAHEAMLQKPYDGLLISKAFIDVLPDSPERTQYSLPQKLSIEKEFMTTSVYLKICMSWGIREHFLFQSSKIIIHYR